MVLSLCKVQWFYGQQLLRMAFIALKKWTCPKCSNDVRSIALNFISVSYAIINRPFYCFTEKKAQYFVELIRGGKYFILCLFRLNSEKLEIHTYYREQYQVAKYELMEHGGFQHLNQCFELIRILLLSCLILL